MADLITKRNITILVAFTIVVTLYSLSQLHTLSAQHAAEELQGSSRFITSGAGGDAATATLGGSSSGAAIGQWQSGFSVCFASFVLRCR